MDTDLFDEGQLLDFKNDDVEEEEEVEDVGLEGINGAIREKKYRLRVVPQQYR